MLERLRAIGPRIGGVSVPRSLALLPVVLNSFGYELRPRGDRYRFDGKQRRPEGLLLQFSLDGYGLLRYGREHYEVPPWHLMLLHWPHDHCYELPPDSHWEHTYLIVSGASAQRLLRGVERELGPVIPCGEEHPVTRGLLSLIIAGLEGGLEDPLLASQQLYALILELVREARREVADRPQAAAIEQAMDYARERLHLAIGVEDLARAAGLSRYHFSRQFARVVGDSPAAWLQAQRLQRALSLLQADERPNLEAVARRCGFANANYFGKVFRKAFGVAPGAFRSTV